MSSPSDIRPGWYHSALPDLGYRVRVHIVHEGRVLFTRVGMAHMSISSVETFRGIVRFPAIQLFGAKGLTGAEDRFQHPDE